MPRFGKRVHISSSQEEILEAISGWDETRAGGIMDETPNEPAYGEDCSQSSLERVFDVSGSSLCSGPSQQAVQVVSPTHMFPRPRTTVELQGREEEDSYNEAFESDRSQSPPRTVSWSLPAGVQGCNSGPKSPITSNRRNAVALQEVERSRLRANLELTRVVDGSNRPIATPPEAPDVTIAELEVDQEAIVAEAGADDKSGRRTGVGIDRVCPKGLPLFQGSLAVKRSLVTGEDSGSASASSPKKLRRKEERSPKHGQPALSGKRHTSVEGETSARSANIYVQLVHNTLDQTAKSVQVNVGQVTDQLEMVEDDHSGNEVKSGDKCEQRKSRVSLLSPMPPKSPDAPNLRPADKAGVARAVVGATEGGSQCTPLSGTRPPRAVQEKLDRLRSQSQIKRDQTKSFNQLEEMLRTEGDMVSSSTVLETIKFRSGEKPATDVTAADLLKTALDVGITLPAPFHRNYFSG